MHAISPTMPAVEDPPDRAVLRDGTVVRLRPTVPGDQACVARFFRDLSPESRRNRFFAMGEPSPSTIARFCDSTDPHQAATLLALRCIGPELRPVAVGTYVRTGGASAEVAFAVDDHVQGKGLGTILLERLAAIAAAHGLERFEAVTFADNAPMLDVFRQSGFDVTSRPDQEAVDVRLSLDATTRAVAAAERRDQIAVAASLHPLLEPASVAVIGASRDAASIGRRVLRALVEAKFAGRIHPVNPNAAELDGLRCYGSIGEVPHGVDLAVVAVPSDRVLGVVDACAAAGVKSLVVITAGFAETGADGRARQQTLVDRVRGYGMRMVGPNCMGLLNTAAAVRLNASFSPIMPPEGRVALSSQSGALGLALLELASDRGIGLSTFVSVGNKADVSSNDLLQYWDGDPRTSVILLYLESFGNPARFARIARRLGRRKPIIAVKSGRTSAGSRAAGSHTAALAASDTAVDALFRQTGVIRAETIDEMFDVAACLDLQPLPPGRRVAIVTNSGGPGILAVDACEGAGLHVPAFAEATCARLTAFLPPEASVGNPIDMIASASPAAYARTVETALVSPDTDALIVIYTPVDPTSRDTTVSAICEGIAAARHAGAAAKPVLACIMAERGRPQPLAARGERVPTYAFPENAARALGRAAAYAEWRAEPQGSLWTFEDIRGDDARSVCEAALARGGTGWLTVAETTAILRAYGLPVAAGSVVRTADEAVAAARACGAAVAAKLAAAALPHKTDADAVRLNLTTEAEVRKAFAEVMAAGSGLARPEDIDGVLVQPMVQGGVETMIGVTTDGVFGPLVGFGLGGIHVELLGDVQFRIAPLTDRDADDMLRRIRARRLLTGYRGRSAVDIEALRDVLLRISRLAVEVPQIAELDLNPVVALPAGQGCRIVDARIRVQAPAARL
jgi:acetyl coenzyme A synthetase (ADP forming)-like protein